MPYNNVNFLYKLCMTQLRAVIKFWVAWGLELHTRMKRVHLNFLSELNQQNTILFVTSWAWQAYSAVTGVRGYGL